LVKDYCLWCHYKLEEDTKILDFIKKYSLKVIALSEDSGAIVTRDKIELVRPGIKSMFK